MIGSQVLDGTGKGEGGGRGGGGVEAQKAVKRETWEAGLAQW